jgi:hypothetical protein
MPVARYFMYVGGALLALLFLIDVYAPSQAVVTSHAAPSIDRNVVRIHSDQKLPERVVYDTSLPTIVPPASQVQVAAAPQPPVAREVTAQARVRDTFAQFVPVDVKKPEPQVQRKRKVARTHANPPMRLAQQQQQQPHFGFFGGPSSSWNSTWNSTW